MLRLFVILAALAAGQDMTEESTVIDSDVSEIPGVSTAPNVSVVWMAPFFSGGGYCSEATAFALGIKEHGVLQMSIQQHGDSLNRDYVFGLPEETYMALQVLAGTPMDRHRTVSICHSEPGAWHLNNNLRQRYATSFCPVLGSAYTIGRTMFETDRAPSGWHERLNAMREVWVPTKWQLEVFAKAGVARSRMHVVPEPVDTGVYRPLTVQDRVQSYKSQAQAWRTAKQQAAAGTAQQRGRGSRSDDEPLFPPRMCEVLDDSGRPVQPPRYVRPGTTPACPYRFLTVGKWERRKGFDILLRALYTAFGRKLGTPEEEEYRVALLESGEAPSVYLGPNLGSDFEPIRADEGQAQAEDGGQQQDSSDIEQLGQQPELQKNPLVTVAAAYVELFVLTSAYHSSSDFQASLDKMVKEELTCGSKVAQKQLEQAGTPVDEQGRPVEECCSSQSHCIEKGRPDGVGRGVLPPVKLLTGVPQRDLHHVYHHVDALVQASRGEGWGRPHVEAMASGLPLLATNWSGPTEFLTDANGYPIKYRGLLPIPDGAFAGHFQAEPSVDHLAVTMRHVVAFQDEAHAKGRRARQDMAEKYSPTTLAELVTEHMHRISAILDADAVAAAAAAEAEKRERAADEERYRRMQAEVKAAAEAQEKEAARILAAAAAEDVARAAEEEKAKIQAAIDAEVRKREAALADARARAEAEQQGNLDFEL